MKITAVAVSHMTYCMEYCLLNKVKTKIDKKATCGNWAGVGILIKKAMNTKKITMFKK